MLDYTINSIVSSLRKYFDDNNSLKKFTDEISQYLEGTYNKFKVTKNLLNRNKPINFYENYIPLSLIGEDKMFRINNSMGFIEENKKSIILGSAGSGKTTLLKHLTLQILEDGEKIPIYVELRNFNPDNHSFQEFICKTLSVTYSKLIEEFFKADKFVFIFDGYDEINYSTGLELINQVENFISKYRENKFIISSRPGTNIESLSSFQVFQLAPINQNDIHAYVSRLSLPLNSKEIFLSRIFNDDFFRQYLTTPLLLTLYVEYFKKTGDRDLSTRKSIFFRNIIDHLFSKHDSISKLGYVRNRLSGLNKDAIETVAQFLAFRSIIKNINSYTKDSLVQELEKAKRNLNMTFENEKLIYDLTITVNILQTNGYYYNFPHILIKEYLGALFISLLSLDRKKWFYNEILLQNIIQDSRSLINFLLELDTSSLVSEFLIPSIIKSRYNEEKMSFCRQLLYDNEYLLKIDNFENMSTDRLLSHLQKRFQIGENNEEIDEIFEL